MSPTTLHLSDPSRFKIREATLADAQTMTDIWFKSFHPTSPFWPYLMPDTPYHRAWFDEAWRMSTKLPTDKQFIVEDVTQISKLVGLSRWMLPQYEGNPERVWPDMDEDRFDMGLIAAFFGGMDENHHAIIGSRPHWYCEMLAVLPEYQNQGIAARLLKFGTDQADESQLETYLDATATGQPYYRGRHKFHAVKPIAIPDHEVYGSYEYVSMVRPPQGSVVESANGA